MKIVIIILLILSLIIIIAISIILLPFIGIIGFAKSCESRYKYSRNMGYELTSWHDDSPGDMAMQMGLKEDEDIQECVEDSCCGLNYDKEYYASKEYMKDTAKVKLKERSKQLLKKKLDVEDGRQKMSAPVKILAASGGACNALFSHYINTDENSVLEHVDLCSIGAEYSESRLPHFKLFDIPCPDDNWEEFVQSKKAELDAFFGDETQVIIFVQTTTPHPIQFSKWQSYILDYIRNRDIAIIGILTLPFMFEGYLRRERSILYISKIEEYFDIFYVYDANDLGNDNQLDFFNCFTKLDYKIGLIIDEILCIINTYTSDGKVNIPRIIYEINKAINYVSLHDWNLIKEHEMRIGMGMPIPILVDPPYSDNLELYFEEDEG